MTKSRSGTPDGRATKARRTVRGPILFVLRFAAAWIAALVVIALFPAIDRRAVRITVDQLVWLVRLAGMPAVTQNDIIQVGTTMPLQIIPDCTPVLPTAALWAAMFAFPVTWRRRLIGMALGAAAIWGFNLARVLMLIAILGWPPMVVNFLHVYVWQAISVLFICTVFVLWVPRRGARVPRAEALQPERPA